MEKLILNTDLVTRSVFGFKSSRLTQATTSPFSPSTKHQSYHLWWMNHPWHLYEVTLSLKKHYSNKYNVLITHTEETITVLYKRFQEGSIVLSWKHIWTPPPQPQKKKCPRWCHHTKSLDDQAGHDPLIRWITILTMLVFAEIDTGIIRKFWKSCIRIR